VLTSRHSSVLALAAALLATASAHALERVHLSTGFAYDCSAHEPIDPTHVRLYTDAARTSFQDISTQLITSIEVLPDPPAPVPVQTPAATATIVAMDIPSLLHQAGALHNLDVDLLYSVVHTESAFNPHAVSRAGARGLMQLMPATARDLNVTDAFRADQNIAGGAAYLDSLLTRYHDDLKLALAAYNAGPAAVDRYHGVPPFYETHVYINRVLREFNRRLAAKEMAASMATITDGH
jgi:soluble lytic murein transglycosylase-like protein